MSQRTLTEAVGYLELGMLQDAWDALEEIPAEQRHLPPVLHVRLEIYRRMEKYEGMATISRKLLQKSPSCLSEQLRLLHEKITKKGLPPPIYGIFTS